jgi:large subunit ribosomal protein L13
MTTTTTNRTFSPRPRDIERRWYVVDADGAVLGRLASEVAKILRGKHKPIFAPHADTGDHVIVVNARGVRLTGGKEGEKVYYRHSGYPGGLREIGYDRLLAERPAVAVEKAIRGMLPKNRLGRQMFTKLKVYEGAEHPHEAQQPAVLALGAIPRWEGLPAPKPPVDRFARSDKGEGTKARTGRRAAADESSGAKRSTAKRGAAKAATAAKRSTAKRVTARGATAAKRATSKRATSKAATEKPATTKATTERTGRGRRSKKKET